MLRNAGIVLVLSVALLLAAPASFPVGLGYVTTDSMEPTIAPGDGYVLVPADPVAEGDVVTFRSPDGDGYVTHRVVATTDGGYVTKGDANPSSDQSAGAPPVTDADVVGEVLAVGGAPVVIPWLGTVVDAVRGNALTAAVATAADPGAVFASDLFADPDDDRAASDSAPAGTGWVDVPGGDDGRGAD